MKYSPLALAALMFTASNLSALILIDDVMTREEQKKTGVYYLKHNQRAALESWLNDNFILKSQKPAEIAPELTLAENIGEGRQLKLSDGSLYEIAPSDIQHSAGWITPFPLRIEPSGDANYPYRIVNVNTGVGLKARQMQGPNS